MYKALVICARRYNGHELWTLLGIFKRRGVKFEVVSTATLIKDELTFRPNTIVRTVYDLDPISESLKFDAICVVSGNMADTEAYWTMPEVQAQLAAFRAKDKVVAAICCSVPTLAPVARDVKVSFFPLVRSRQRLQEHGAILQTVSLTRDKRTITAENQMITEMWANEIVNELEGKPQQYVLVDSGYVPKGRLRRMPKEVQASIDQARNEKI